MILHLLFLVLLVVTAIWIGCLGLLVRDDD